MFIISLLTGKLYEEKPDNEGVLINIPLDNNHPDFIRYLESLETQGPAFLIEATPKEIAEANKPIVPIQVKNMKFRLALIKSGIMPSSIDSVITQMPEGTMKENIFTLWNFADYLERNDVSLNYMAGQFNITHEQLDNLFILSDTL